MPKGVRFRFQFQIKSNRIPEVIDELANEAIDVVDGVARDLRDFAYQLAPVDTGALRTSIYLNNGDDLDDYSEQVGFAENLNPEMDALDRIDPEFVIPLSVSAGQGGYFVVVGVAAHYGIFLEEGTVFQPAQPYMRPSAEAFGPELQDRMAQMGNHL